MERGRNRGQQTVHLFVYGGGSHVLEQIEATIRGLS